MLTAEKRAAEALAKAFDALPENKKERLLGYAEGVIDMAARLTSKKEPNTNEQNDKMGEPYGSI